MNSIKNDLLLKTIQGDFTQRPPVWLMRQAGRILPQYRKIRNSLSGFKELVQTPDLLAEVTVQPVDELGVDAAILFSDILVIPEAMGLDYELIEKKGPSFPVTIKSKADVDRLLSGAAAAEKLGYVYDGIDHTKKALEDRVPLIGFAGAPWTLLAYMIEGGGSKTFAQAKKFLYQENVAAHELLNKITETTIAYLKLKIKHGCNVIQVFDSWAGLLGPTLYAEFAIPYIKRICKAIDEVPIIVFSKGAWFAINDIARLSCDVVGLDWNFNPANARAAFGNDLVFQGNLDPCCLYAPEAVIVEKTEEMLKAFGRNHIANLGHGVYPDTPLDNVKVFVNTVKNYRYAGKS